MQQIGNTQQSQHKFCYTMDPTLENKLEAFRKTVATAGEDIVFRTFPSKILELHELIQIAMTPESPFHLSHASASTNTTIYPPPKPSSTDEPQTKKRKGVNGTVENGSDVQDITNSRFPNLVLANKHTTSIHGTVKKECEQLILLVDQVKLWVTLTMPKIEDGDNFGVQIQEEVLNELHRAQESAYNLRDGCRQDHLARAKICTKLIKYPNVEDYALSLKEHDEKQLYLSRQHLFDIRNIYAVVTDLIHKNITKIRAPKANNSIGLY
ncbi:proteasome activator pa28 REG alpha/beta subunit [Infundibulicybe gibba]|nr:proteasome activator pa28 REG alpha/beta subunit [Infundibulicybe gibba]